MNPKLQTIFNRRSIRQYNTDVVSKEMLQDLLKAAMAAPSAVAKDPWEFIVVQDKEKLIEIAKGLPYGRMLNNAGAAIVVCGDINQVHKGEFSYLLQDCSAAIENLLIAATEFGLGTCWLGVHPREDRINHIKNMYSLPENVIPLAVISIGWPLKTADPRTRYHEGKVHWEKW